MLDHIGIGISDYARAKASMTRPWRRLVSRWSWKSALKQTGDQAAAGFGSDGKPYFWFGGGTVARMHVAFAAKSRAAVDAFYQAALAAGGRDNGGPGLRPHYHANYYAAFVLDPDGHNIEAVCHLPQ